MAIIIPSSKIYQSHNDKIKINKIERFDIKTKDILISNSTPINYSESIEPTETILPEQATIDISKNSAFEFGEGKSGDYYVTTGYTISTGTYTSAFLFALNKTYYQEIKILIPVSDISNIDSGVQEIFATINVSYNLKHPVAKVKLENKNAVLTQSPDYEISLIEIVPDSGSPESYNDKIPTVVSVSYGDKLLWNKSISIEKGYGSIGKIPLKINQETQCFEASTHILCGALQASGSNTEYGVPTVGYKAQLYKEFRCNQYIPQSILLSLEGSATTYEITDSKIIVGNPSSQNSMSFNGNELIQSKNYWIYPDNPISATEKLYSSVLSQYKNGKETATLKCSFGEYYDEDSAIPKIGFTTATTSILDEIFSQYDKATQIDGVFWEKTSGEYTINAGRNSGTKDSTYVLYENSKKTDKPFTLDMRVKGKKTTLDSKYSDGEVNVYWYNENGEIKLNYALWLVDNEESTTITIKECYGIAKIDFYANRNLETASFTFDLATRTQLVGNATFEVGDIVIPQKYAVTDEGLKDVPMSMRIVTFIDAETEKTETFETPKAFEVVGVNFIYDGASWQELLLEEYN